MKYLVATDGSRESHEAIEYATTHAVALDASLEILHVVAPETDRADAEGDPSTDPDAAGEATLERARELAASVAEERGSEVPVETALRRGRPVSVIVEYAEEIGADALYLGHQVLAAPEEAVVGSVAKNVLDTATIPVTIVR